MLPYWTLERPRLPTTGRQHTSPGMPHQSPQHHKAAVQPASSTRVLRRQHHSQRPAAQQLPTTCPHAQSCQHLRLPPGAGSALMGCCAELPVAPFAVGQHPLPSSPHSGRPPPLPSPAPHQPGSPSLLMASRRPFTSVSCRTPSPGNGAQRPPLVQQQGTPRAWHSSAAVIPEQQCQHRYQHNPPYPLSTVPRC